MKKSALLVLVIFILGCCTTFAQTTAFTYQGSLTDTTLPANGTYDFQFTVHDNDGLPASATLTITGVTVANGVFTVMLDFGFPGPFSNGQAIDMQIKVKRAADPTYTPLDPRQTFTSSPYAINSLFANVANTANHATTAGSVSGILSITNGGTGSATKNFVDLTTAQTIGGNKTFTGTISGDGSGLTNLNGAAFTNLNASNITTGTLSNARLGIVPTANGGTGLGLPGTAGNFLRSIGTIWTSDALQSTDIPAGSPNYIQNGTEPQALAHFNVSGTGSADIFNAATQYNIGGTRAFSIGAFNNSTFAGANAGAVTTGGQNSFFGANAGWVNTDGIYNSFFGTNAGQTNISGDYNAFFGAHAGSTTMGDSNTFIGSFAGQTNLTGNNNTVIGALANVGIGNLQNATAIGAGAIVDSDNTLVLGRNLDTVKVPGHLTVNGMFTANGVISGNGSGLNSLNGANILENSITVAQYGSQSVNEDALRDGSVTTDKLADGAVTMDKIAPGLATSENTPNTLVKRDANGDFSANVIKAETVGIGTTTPSSTLSVVTGSAELAGTALSATLRTTAGNLGQNPGDELSLASIGFFSASNSSLGIRAHRTATGPDWTTTAIGLGMDVDNSVRAGAALWLNANGNIGIGTTTPTERLNVVGNGLFSGNLTGNEVATVTSFNIGAQKILSNAGFNNLFVGDGAGLANTLGDGNTFAGRLAGSSNTEGRLNAFFGQSAGQNNVGGNINSFFGREAGFTNTTGVQNSFFGADAGRANNGTNNSFFGVGAGQANIDGGNNTAIGAFANFSSPGLNFATAIGAGSTVTTDNTIVLGRVQDTVKIAGTISAPNFDAQTEYRISGSRVLSAPGDGLFVGVGAGAANEGTSNSFFGRNAGAANWIGAGNTFAGTNSGFTNYVGGNNSFFGASSGQSNISGSGNSFFGNGAGSTSTGSNNTFVGASAGDNNGSGDQNTFIGKNARRGGAAAVNHSTAIGADAVVSTNNTVVLGTATDDVEIPGDVKIHGGLKGTGIDEGILTIDSRLRLTYPPLGGQIPMCLNVDTNIVSLCIPAPRNEEIDAQKTRIETLQEQLKQQQAEIEGLKKLICSQNPTAEICQPKN